jgi:hypothetical protein
MTNLTVPEAHINHFANEYAAALIGLMQSVEDWGTSAGSAVSESPLAIPPLDIIRKQLEAAGAARERYLMAIERERAVLLTREHNANLAWERLNRIANAVLDLDTPPPVKAMTEADARLAELEKKMAYRSAPGHNVWQGH